MGRPTKYTEALALKIFATIASSPYGLDKICRLNPDLPVSSTIRQWAHDKPNFSARYEAAFEQQSHLLFKASIDELESLEDCYYVNSYGGQEVSNGMVAFKKALSDRKAKHAAILNKKYRIKKDDDEEGAETTLTKIRDMVNDLNKTNTSEI